MYNYSQKIKIKEYNTLIIQCKYTDDEGKPLDISDITISSHIENENKKIVDKFNVEKINEELGYFKLSPTKETFKPGEYRIDILFEISGKRVSSESFSIYIESSITKPVNI